MIRNTVKEITKRGNETVASFSFPLYNDIFPISRKTSLASCSARMMAPTRENLEKNRYPSVQKLETQSRGNLDSKVILP